MQYTCIVCNEKNRQVVQPALKLFSLFFDNYIAIIVSFHMKNVYYSINVIPCNRYRLATACPCYTNIIVHILFRFRAVYVETSQPALYLDIIFRSVRALYEYISASCYCTIIGYDDRRRIVSCNNGSRNCL